MVEKLYKILVVDDLADWRSTLGGLLADQGYEVIVADSQNEALEVLSKNQVDLALVDVRLDDSDEDNIEGLSLASKISQRWPKIKIILVTGYITPEIVRSAMEPNQQGHRLVTDFVEKTKIEEMVIKVHQVLNQDRNQDY